MGDTYMEFRESSSRQMSRVYYGDHDTTNMMSVSADWGGGGLVSTTSDLHKFIRALFSEGALLSKKSLLDMKTWRQVSPDKSVFYGGGVGSKITSIGRVIGHSGATGSFVRFQPELDLSFSGSFNQYNFDTREFEEKLVKLISKYIKK